VTQEPTPQTLDHTRLLDDILAGWLRNAPVDARPLQNIERTYIAAVLKATNGNVSRAARELHIDRVTLYNKIRKYGLRKPEQAA
jgi:transcriptional regulator of acetoin/glycerol metabolism